MKSSRLVGLLGLSAIVLSSSTAFALGDTFAAEAAKKGDTKPKGSGETVKLDDTAAKEKRAAAGYAYSDKGPKRASAGPRVVRTGPHASFPSFRETEGGGSRIVVHLSASVPVEERKAAGSVTYILKGAHVSRWNDTNPLVTVHFNTPVVQARLVPHGADLHLVIALRGGSAPTFKVEAAPQGTAGATLAVDFPKGDFVPTERATDTKALPKATTAPGASPAPTPAPATAPAPAPAKAEPATTPPAGDKKAGY